MRIFVSLTLMILVLTGCQASSESELITSDLDLQKTEGEMKIYSAKNLDTALNALPFSVELPTHLPGDIQYEKFIITENKEKNQLVLDVVGESEDKTHQIAIGVSNNVSKPLNFENKSNVINLDNNQEALYFPDKSYKDGSGWMSKTSYLRWNKKNIDYIVAYKNSEEKNVKETLIDLANQMQ